MLCPFCKTENSPLAKRCDLCDAFLPSQALVVSVGDGLGSEQESLYKAYLGERNQAYYLYHFAHFDREGQATPSWNAWAFFLTLFWLVYRKMYWIAGLYFFVPFVVAFSTIMLEKWFPQMWVLWSLLKFVVNIGVGFVVIPLYANALYYWTCRRKIRLAQATVAGLSEQCRYLAKEGGVSLRPVAYTVAGIWVLTIVILLIIAPKIQHFLDLKGGIHWGSISI